MYLNIKNLINLKKLWSSLLADKTGIVIAVYEQICLSSLSSPNNSNKNPKNLLSQFKSFINQQVGCNR